MKPGTYNSQWLLIKWCLSNSFTFLFRNCHWTGRSCFVHMPWFVSLSCLLLKHWEACLDRSQHQIWQAAGCASPACSRRAPSLAALCLSAGTRWRRRTWWCGRGACWRTGAGGYPTTGWAPGTTSPSTSSLWSTATSSPERSTKSGYRTGSFLERACKRQEVFGGLTRTLPVDVI